MDATLIAAFFGVASALTWGTGDFLGGLAARKANAYLVVVVGDLVGGVLLALVAFAIGEPFPGWWVMGVGAVAGLAGAVGLVALYRALASGQMSIASPLAAVTAAIIPVVVSLTIEGWPGWVTMLGFALALGSVWLMSNQTSVRGIRWNELGLPLLAGLGFGIFFVLMDSVSSESVLWPPVAGRVAATIMLLIIARALGHWRWPTLPEWRGMGVVGILDTGANVLFMLASRFGRLDVASILSSIYPVATVLLAWLVLKERVARWQFVGIALAFVAIVLITL